MFRRPTALLMALLLMILPAASMAEQAGMDEQVDGVFRAMKAVGGAFVVAQHGEIVYERYYGVQHKKTNEPVTEKSYFRCASVTKLVTGIGIMKMIDEGLLPVPRFDEPKDVAKMVLACCSGLLDYAAGQVLNADGGFALRRL